jgi:Tol biopolymer transport system component
VLVVLLFADPAEATFPGEKGRLALYVVQANDPQQLTSTSRIATVNPDGTGFTYLTDPAELAASDPAWSPDGAKIAYAALGDPTVSGIRHTDLFVIDANGGNRRRLTNTTGADERMPAWSRDGSRIAFMAGYPYGSLDVIDADGGNRVRLIGPTPAFGWDITSNPDWSPAEDKIAFQLYEIGYFCDEPEDPTECFPTPGSPDINVIQAEGSGLTALTESGFAFQPSWSPDGNSILFALGGGQLFAMNSDGTGLSPIGNARGGGPVWSPDGTKIAVGTGNGDIAVMDADGTGQSTVLDGGQTVTSPRYWAPDWQPIPNHPPDCSGVAAAPDLLWPANRKLRLVGLSGASDPDGDAVASEVTGVTQDEPARGAGDAQPASAEDAVGLRADRDPRGDGRVYKVAFEATDGKGASCTGVATVSVPRHRGAAAVDSAPPSYGSFGR